MAECAGDPNAELKRDKPAMGLTEYRRKRDFRATAEPRGERATPVRRKRPAGPTKLAFVIQKHAASHLHYDFRLEHDGVLKSWAVPKGPDLDPAEKRLAMQVEDHPLEYGGFEGTIPKGQYGGGTVMLWDRGTWEPVGDAGQGLRDGALKFVLHGQKVQGKWMIVRRGGKKGDPGERHWFLFKERDEFAKPGENITESQPLSVATGRDLGEIAQQSDRVWNSGRGNGEPARSKATKAKHSTTMPASQKATAGRRKSAPAVRQTSGEVRDGKGKSQFAEVLGVRLTHPEKVLYPENGITKLALANYYEQVADWMLPHVINRPMALVRCPAGRGKPCFFQKHPGEGETAHLLKVNIAEKGKAEYHLAVRDAAGLMELVQMGVLEVHVWGSQSKNLEKPDRLVFDLDPDPAVEWGQVVTAAREVRLLLEELGLVSFLKTTGGKGLHLVVPIQPRTGWDDAKSFCRALADFVVQAAPDRYIATMSKAARKGKVFIDYLRNGRGATAVAPYSTRARPGATVSVPLAWEELIPSLRPDQFTIASVPARLAKLKKDPWAALPKTKQTITKAMRKQLEL
jgi:bifunctional non-homologous end joining protein LigD